MEREDLIDCFKYREVRLDLLRKLGRADSNRDPLAEFSERLAEVMLGAKRADRREQEGYDLESPDGQKIEVKYVTQVTKKDGSINWKNWHVVQFNDCRDKYALFVFVDLQPRDLFVFSKSGLSAVCKRLMKRHSNQDSTLQFTKTDYQEIKRKPAEFRELGVEWFHI
jgi:hypothetical protein